MNRATVTAAFQLISLCGAAIFVSQRVADCDDFDLKRYRDNNRLVFVFAPEKSNSFYRRQSALWKDRRAGMNARALVRFDVFEREKGTAGDTVLAAADAAALRKRFGVRRGAFRVVLVGKDGHTALFSGKPVPSARLFGLIDAMPMRRQEMQRRRTSRPDSTGGK